MSGLLFPLTVKPDCAWDGIEADAKYKAHNAALGIMTAPTQDENRLGGKLCIQGLRTA